MTKSRPADDRNNEAIIYCRVSDKSQLERGNGIDSQRQVCEEYASREGYSVIGVFEDDLTGKTAKRPGIKEMLSLLTKRRRSTHVIIDHGNRLARSLRAHYAVRDAITAAGGKLQTPHRRYMDNPDDDFSEIIEAAVAGEQRRQNAEQTVRRMRGRLLGGNWCLQLPRGYRYRLKQSKKDPAVIERDEPLASIIQSALEGFACGELTTQADVARFFSSHPEFPRQSNGRVRDEAARLILRNPFFAGYIQVPHWDISLRPGHHPALISFETFQKIQRRLDGASKGIVRKDNSADFALRGYVVCSCCGTKLTAYWAKARFAYYHCREKSCEAYSQSIPRAKIEGEFAELMTSMTPSIAMFGLIEGGLRKLWKDQEAQASERKKSLAAQIRAADETIRKLVDRTLDSTSPAMIAACEQRLSEEEANRAELKEKLANCGRPLVDFDGAFRTAMVFLENPGRLWAYGQIELRHLLLKLAFIKPLQYAKNQGFRTPLTSSPFRLFSPLMGGVEELARPKRFELLTS